MVAVKSRFRCCPTAAVFVAIVALLQVADAQAIEHFVTANGNRLVENGKPFRFISFNIPNLFLGEDNLALNAATPWRWTNEYEMDDALESIRQLGGQVVRTYVLSVQREGADIGDHVFVRGPGDFNEQAFRQLDLMLATARKKGVRVIIPLVDNWHWWGGIKEYAAFRGKEPDDFWTDPQVIADFEETIRHTLGRVNTISGIAYRDDPAIFGWETGNELDSPPAWTKRIAALMKRLAPNHLIIDGNALNGVRESSLNDPNIDVVTTHHYPNVDGSESFARLIREANRRIAGRKPYFVGEFGFVGKDEIEAALNAATEENVSGALLWSLRFHNRDGGFYWHSEPAGGELYKAYHWPGFASGDAYEEKEVIELMRRYAAAIRRVPMEKLPVPQPPTLLPIKRPAEISWQGSAGATHYRIERAEHAAGPWGAIALDISDARVQYRPLWHDASAIPQKSYFYRVAAANDSGISPPSNVVGPVAAKSRILIDEARDLASLAKHTGDVSIETGNDRRVREDAHRIRIGPGGSIAYHVPGRIVAWTAHLYSEESPPGVRVEISADGTSFAASEFEPRDFSASKNDYNYLALTTLRGKQLPPNGQWLRLVASPAQTILVSRIEVAYE